ncbi:MAG: hypothetical protein A2408_03945 [Candidatus Yonathbacteria bacterium RIFOXYC1_FULL_52_10]|nr:MAG: hypothetical protein A2408_03945 [Candidatus Yonathbacteria bacterium RIFOXYC1_FULL_52_10]
MRNRYREEPVMIETAPHVPAEREALQNLISLLEVTIEPATGTAPTTATLWFVTSSEKNQRHALATASGMYDTPLLSQLNDALEVARAALGKTEAP